MTNVQSPQGAATKAPPIPTMDGATPPAPTAAQLRQQAADLAKQSRTAAKDARIAAKNLAQDAAKQIATTVPPLAFNPSDMIPPQAVEISEAFFFTVAFCVVGFPIARAIARRFDRKTEFKSVAGPDLRPQMQQLQESVDAMAIELERISEGQRFTTKVLTERSSSSS